MVTLEEAMAQRRAFNTMVAACTVRQVKIHMHAQWREWKLATETLEELDGEGTYAVGLACEIVPGTYVYDDQRGDCRLVRKLERDGQMSLHVEDKGGRPVYFNLVGATSPVVVLDIPVATTDTAPADEPINLAKSLDDEPEADPEGENQ